MEIGSQKGELLCHTIPCSPLQNQQKEAHFAFQKQRSLYFTNLEEEKKEERFSVYPATVQPMRYLHNLTNEKPLHFKLPVYSN